MTQNSRQKRFTRDPRTLTGFALAILLAGSISASAETATFTRVGFLPGDDFSSVNVANDAGTLAACLSYHRDPMTFQKIYTNAARWTPAEGMQPLPLLSDTPNAQVDPFHLSISGRDVTNDGSRIVYNSYTTTGNLLAAGIAGADGSDVLNLTALPNGDQLTRALQISDDGTTVFGAHLGGVSGFAFIGSIWTAAGGVRALVPPAGFAEVGPAAGAISSDGSVSVGTAANTNENGVYLDAQAYRWTAEGGVQLLGYLPGDNRSTADNLSADGGTILGSSWFVTDSSAEIPTPFLWTAASGMTALSPPQISVSSDLSGGSGLSADGEIIMISGRVRRLDYPYYFAIDDLLVQAGAGEAIEGWSSFSIYGLSDDGNTVWGQACSPDKKLEGFIAKFPAGYFRTLVAPRPEITSALAGDATVGFDYSYMIEASAFPETFGATDLPPGLELRPGIAFDGGLKVGIISGVPTTPGIYEIPISATNVEGTANATLTLTIHYNSFAPRLLNISTRANVLTDDKVLIAGFIIPEGGPKNVILRAIGPSLTDFGVTGALADPTLELHYPDGTTMANDDWKEAQQSEIEATGLNPSNDREAALVATLDPGLYTAIVSGKNGSTGVGLVEVYDLDEVVISKMANISTRGFIESGDNVLIGGIIVEGSFSAQMVIRALGPTLADVGVAGALSDTTLEIHGPDGSTLFANDDWRELQETEIEESGLAPNHDEESAVIATLPSGNYTAIVRGKDDAIGVGLVEVYNVD